MTLAQETLEILREGYYECVNAVWNEERISWKPSKIRVPGWVYATLWAEKRRLDRSLGIERSKTADGRRLYFRRILLELGPRVEFVP